jgi:hypothetical protein
MEGIAQAFGIAIIPDLGTVRPRVPRILSSLLSIFMWRNKIYM